MMDDQTKAAVKVFAAVQIIAENAKKAQSLGMDPIMKVRLNKLRVDCLKLNKDFWQHLGEDEEKVFQDKLRKIEKILEE